MIFNFGSTIWPGLSKVMEECGEVVQVCGKLMATSGAVAHWDGTNLKTRLEEELADVLAATTFVITHCELDRTSIIERARLKLALFDRWHGGASTQITSADQVRDGVRLLKRKFLGWRIPPVDLPPDSMIEEVVSALIAMGKGQP
jgi:NTP pyrophosphatase (non-canonical NTP hydrolase)